MHQVILNAPPNSPFPSIEVSFAPLQEGRSPERVRPETTDDAFRPAHLLPPPIFSPKERGMSSKPLGSARVAGQGLSSDAFQSLLKSTRDGKGSNDLRKEIAMKAQRSKLLERRARFLSKLGAPPSPSAADLPVTPPDSPAIFHYSLPSPGLDSPLIVFERHIRKSMVSRKAGDRSGWVEQVDFRVNRASKPPSLDEISAHLSSTEKPVPGANQNGDPRDLVREILSSGTSPQRRPSPPIGPRQARVSMVPSLDKILSDSTRGTTVSRDSESSRVRTGRDMMSTLRRRVQDYEGADIDRQLRRASAPAEMTQPSSRVGFQHPVLAHPSGF